MTAPQTLPQPSPGAPIARSPILRRHSLLWFLSERTARVVAWVLVLLVCVAPLALAAAAALRLMMRDEDLMISGLLAERLGMPVRVQGVSVEPGGAFRFGALEAASGGFSLRAEKGFYQADADDGGRLSLEGGTLALDVTAFAEAPSQDEALLLADARENRELRALILSGFAARLTFSGQSIALSNCAGRAWLSADGAIHAHLSGRTETGALIVTFEIADGRHAVTLSGEDLPWAQPLLAQTLGETLSALLKDARGTLTLSNDPATGGADDAWRVDLSGTLDLSALPPAWGLGELSGVLEVDKLVAFGRMNERGTLRAQVALAECEGAVVSVNALRNISYLLTGGFGMLEPSSATQRLDDVAFSLIVTPNQVCLTQDEGAPPAGLSSDGKPLIALPLGRFIELDVLQERLEELARRWRRQHEG